MSLAQSIFRETVKSIIVEMTCNDELPMDMNELDIDAVFDKAEEMVKEDENYKNAQAYDLAGEFLVPDDELDVIEQVNAILEEYETDPSGMIDHVEGVLPTEQFQYSFTNKDFLSQIGLIDK